MKPNQTQTPSIKFDLSTKQGKIIMLITMILWIIWVLWTIILSFWTWKNYIKWKKIVWINWGIWIVFFLISSIATSQIG